MADTDDTTRSDASSRAHGEPSLDELEAKAFAPALLADVGGVWLALHRLRQREDLPADLRLRAELRHADLLRRFIPEDAIATLDRLGPIAEPPPPPLDPEAIRIHALLEQGKGDEAAARLPFVQPEQGLFSLLQARLAVFQGHLDEAQDALDQCLSQATLAEIRAEALGLKVRLQVVQRQDATAALDALDALLDRHQAGLSKTLFGLIRRGVEHDLFATMSEGLVVGGLARLKAAYTFGFQQDAAKVAPIPLEVHAAAVRHRDEPERYVRAVIAFAALTWRTGDHLRAYAIATLGHRIGARIHGEPAVLALAEFLTGLEAEADRDELRQLQAALAEAARRKTEPRPAGPPEA